MCPKDLNGSLTFVGRGSIAIPGGFSARRVGMSRIVAADIHLPFSLYRLMILP
ncbi:hypothetical protein SFHH103_00709 [Sinorhizobium fredii HH103]|uniref:Uncharacterized protein n=1 Tax=Sinorhizobium fredii (strain HH103) TaxID=1117943 RepID=G9A2T4_SINF1|nr:hypothetical protein SFHH103_00709 [Sinorhizobium fredii HH103]